MKYASIGSISHGTMRAEDLIPDFAWELNSLIKKQTARFKRAKYRALIREADKIARNEAWDSEEAGYCLESLFDALNDFAPPYTYFGAHEGDGSDYGFWPSIDTSDPNFDGLRVENIGDIPVDYSGEVFEINDHGNVTFGYARKGRFQSVWACV